MSSPCITPALIRQAQTPKPLPALTGLGRLDRGRVATEEILNGLEDIARSVSRKRAHQMEGDSHHTAQEMRLSFWRALHTCDTDADNRAEFTSYAFQRAKLDGRAAATREIAPGVSRDEGRRQLTREREEYFRLVKQGVSYAEAARTVGINLRTGKRWRNGRNVSGRNRAAAPVRPVLPPCGASRYLREEDRIYIADRLREKATALTLAEPAVAAVLGVTALGERLPAVSWSGLAVLTLALAVLTAPLPRHR
ncbi:hypothetical protein [Kitasatospora sp. NPDC056184]|uniref:hypothetical protein n=1 Tax=Kitasatospora sp. NPDC056184 TaxID=3345738 RepID=UPI0035DF132F